MLPHEYHEFRLFAEGSVIPPEHRLMLVNFHRECIGNAKKAQWDRAITLTLLEDKQEPFIDDQNIHNSTMVYTHPWSKLTYVVLMIVKPMMSVMTILTS